MLSADYFGETALKQDITYLSTPCEITQSYTFAALIRLSTTTHNLLTFNISEISSYNSEKTHSIGK